MKRFHFRLQKVLDARKNVEKETQRRLGEAQQVLLELEQKRSQLLTELTEIRNQQRAMLQGSLTAGSAMQYHRWQRELEKSLRVQNEKCDEAEAEVTRRREELLEATRERKVLEHLKDKRREEHNQLLSTQQQAVLDDIGGQRNNRETQFNGVDPHAGRAS